MRHLARSGSSTKAGIFYALAFCASTSLSAQATVAYKTTHVTTSEIAHSVHLLEQTSLHVLLGIIAIIGLAWLVFVFRACIHMDRAEQSRRPYTLMVLMVALGALCGSCTMQQSALTAMHQTNNTTEKRDCMIRHSQPDYREMAYQSHFPYKVDSYWQNPTFCKLCGERVFSNR